MPHVPGMGHVPGGADPGDCLDPSDFESACPRVEVMPSEVYAPASSREPIPVWIVFDHEQEQTLATFDTEEEAQRWMVARSH